MKIFPVALLFLAIFISPVMAADDTFPTIFGVDFYPSGARFIFNVEPDENGNVNAILPGAFNPDSVRLFKSTGARIQATRKRRLKWIPDLLVELNDQIESQKTSVSDLICRKNSLEQSLEILSNEDNLKSMNAADALKFITESQKLRLKTEYELAELKLDLEKEQAALKILQEDLNSRRPANDEYCVEITGIASDAIQIEAFTNYASWSPKYILDMKSRTGDIETYMYVDVAQRTGLDYNGEISLHTKNRDEIITDPSLNPVKVAIKKEKPAAAPVRMSKAARNDMVMMDAAYLESAVNEEALGSAAPTLANAIKETISDRVITFDANLTGDGKNYVFEPVSMTLLRSTPEIILIPEVRENAWFIANMDDNNPKLIPGNAELRVDGHTTGNIYIPEFGQGQQKITFGYADQITVKKESLIETTGVEWFSGVSTSGYKLEITNGTEEKRVVTVRDRLPIPTEDKIKLEVKKIEPAQKSKDAENRYTWELEIEPGKTAEIVVDYKLSFPSGEELEYRK